MDLRIERSRRGRVAQRRNRLGMATLAGERGPEVERGVRLLGSCAEHRAKRALGLGKLLPLQVRPPTSEGRVDRRRRRRSGETVTATSAVPQRGDEPSKVHETR